MNIGDQVLQTLMDAIPAPIFYKDAELIYRGCNAAFIEFIGLPRERIIGQSVYGISPPELAAVYHQADKELLQKGGVQIYDADVRYADGTTHTVEFRKSVFRDAETGAAAGMIGVMLDVTALRSAEAHLLEARDRAEAANRSKSLFLANVSHELRTPLNAILGFSQVIHDEVLGPVNNRRYVDYAGDIVRSGGYLLRLIDNILDLSQVEADRSELDITSVDLAALVEECVSDIRIGVGAGTAISLVSEVASDTPSIETDGAKLRQILLNLVTNAVKYNSVGGTCVISADTGAGFIDIRVRDDGIGISPDELSTVFTPFQRASTRSERPPESFGLGLPLSKTLAERLGGTLTIDSEVGVGTTATISLPRDRASLAGNRAGNASPSNTEPSR